VTHGLGLILKGTKIDFQRINILSRTIGLWKGQAIMVRLIDKVILTNSTCSSKLTFD